MPKIATQRAASKPKPKPSTDNAWDISPGIKILLYGKSGSGKTTLWATFPGPTLCLICSGGKRPGELRSIDTPENRKKITPKIINDSSDIVDLLKTVDQYETVVLDHVTGFQDLVLKEILGIEEIPVQKGWGLASQQQYGQCTQQCKEILRTLLSLPQNVVIIAQEREFNTDNENTSELLSPVVGAALTPSLVGWLNPACDYICQTFLRPQMITKTVKMGGKEQTVTSRGKGVEYCLRTAPHDVFTTKFRLPRGANRELPEVIVDPSYDKLEKLIKG